MYSGKGSKETPLVGWRLATRNFGPNEKKFVIGDLNIRLVRFSEHLNPLGGLSEIIYNDLRSARGFIWIESGHEEAVPCVIYDARELFAEPEDPGSLMAGIWSKNNLVNAMVSACSDARCAGVESATVFESTYDPNLVGWMIESIDSLSPTKESGWLPRSADGTW
tara:strand:+ start:13416 stop:13910 length:495 start_codon:yes stop_codon:yes gene_type:complete